MLSGICKDKLINDYVSKKLIESKHKQGLELLVAERPHNKYGSAVFIRDDLYVKGIYVCEEDDVELITFELCNAIIQSPNKQFIFPPLQQRIKPYVVIGDFNNHNTLWGYSITDS